MGMPDDAPNVVRQKKVEALADEAARAQQPTVPVVGFLIRPVIGSRDTLDHTHHIEWRLR
jgi:hypothetical protein